MLLEASLLASAGLEQSYLRQVIMNEQLERLRQFLQGLETVDTSGVFSFAICRSSVRNGSWRWFPGIASAILKDPFFKFRVSERYEILAR